jgi:hypothetical protein
MSRTRAINLMCKQCIYDKSAEGTWRKQVELCTADTCPLYKYRPKSFQNDTKDVDISEIEVSQTNH